ncbi:MAG: Gfo/Idh/MocA family oxidoreductase [Armatimonadota bacterium]
MPQAAMSRRDVLKRAGIGAATLVVGSAARRVLGANERIGLASIGCGGRGTALMGQARNHAEELNVDFVAVCDVYRPTRERAVARIKDWTGREPRAFSRFADLLALDEVDAVIIATPDFAHSPILAAAATAGKDAYCEKPMATNMADANAAVKAVEDGERVVQIGTQRRSSGSYKGVADLIQSGVLGKITKVDCCYHDHKARWEGSATGINPEDVDWEQYLMGLPKRPFDPRRFRRWHLYKDYSNGTPGLLGSHAIDAAVWFMDDPLPTSGVAHGGVYVWENREHADTIDCLLEYPKGWLLNYSTKLGNSFCLANYVLYGTAGTFDMKSMTARGEGGGSDKLQEDVRPEARPSEDHMKNWLECIRSREAPNAPVRAGYAHSVAAIISDLSWRTGRRYAYDAEREELRPG